MSHTVYACPKCDREMFRAPHPVGDDSFLPLQKFVCPDCKTKFPWYQFRIRSSTLALTQVGGGGAGPAATPTLQQTIFATGGREFLIVDDFDGDSTVAQFDINTAAGTHDGSDLTLDSVHMADGPTGLSQSGSGHMEVIYTMDPITFSGTIAFLRYHFKAWHVDVAGARFNQISAIWTVAGFGATNTLATQSTLAGAPTEINLDIALNPTTGLPWTAAGFNARKAGFQLDCFTLNGVGDGSESFTLNSEFWVEVWGT